MRRCAFFFGFATFYVFGKFREILPRFSQDRKVDFVLQSYAARAGVGAMWRELLLYSQRIASRNRSDYHVRRPKTSCSASTSQLSRDVPGRLDQDARIRIARAAHPASAAWSSMTTRRGGIGPSRLACLPLCSMANWPMKHKGTKANREVPRPPHRVVIEGRCGLLFRPARSFPMTRS